MIEYSSADIANLWEWGNWECFGRTRREGAFFRDIFWVDWRKKRVVAVFGFQWVSAVREGRWSFVVGVWVRAGRKCSDIPIGPFLHSQPLSLHWRNNYISYHFLATRQFHSISPSTYHGTPPIPPRNSHLSIGLPFVTILPYSQPCRLMASQASTFQFVFRVEGGLRWCLGAGWVWWVWWVSLGFGVGCIPWFWMSS